jgi:hypothetical protein
MSIAFKMTGQDLNGRHRSSPSETKAGRIYANEICAARADIEKHKIQRCIF